MTMPVDSAARLLLFLQGGPYNHATRGFPPPFFYDKTKFMKLNRTRDDAERRTLTATFTNDEMTVSMCVNGCSGSPNYYAYAGIESGSECCECTSLDVRCL